jgi:hypothetical protein
MVKLSCRWRIGDEVALRSGYSTVAYANVWTAVHDIWRRSTSETVRSHEFVSSASHCCDQASHSPNSMLATKLSRAQLELQSHRIWLRTFGLRSTSSSFSTTAQKYDDRPLVRKVHRPARAFGKQTTHDNSQPGKPFAQRKQAKQDSEIAALQNQIIDASAENNFDQAMVAYRQIENKKLIIKSVLNELTRSMVSFSKGQLVASESRADPEMSEKVQQYREELVQDVCKGELGPCRVASAHLLNGLLATKTWDTAAKFWKWLEAQEDEYVDADVYASAIQVLAAQDAKLEDLEALYQQGLARFPAGFASYHFSPGAILPDREHKVLLSGSPTPLLFAIMQARLMRGDVQNAYLALDAMLRLKPVGANAHFYHEYQKERPVSEAYTVFAMACKAGTQLTLGTYRSLLSSLRTNADSNNAKRFVVTVRAMLSATYLQIGAGGRLNKNSVTELVIVLSNILRIQGVSRMPAEDRLRLGQAVQELINKTIELAARFSGSPTIAAYNSIITNVGGAGNAEPVITAAIREAKVLGLNPTFVTRRSIVVAAGSANDPELVKKAWKWLVDEHTRLGQQPDPTDLHILTKACVQVGLDYFAADVITQASHIEDWQRDNLLERLEKRTDVVSDRSPPAKIDDLLAEVAKINADLEVFDTNTSDAKGAQDFSNQTVPMLLFPPPKDVRLPEAEMRELYDELTTDPSSPRIRTRTYDPQDTAALVTKVSFGQLRYESWKLITYLLAESQAHDKAYIKAVDEAISKGERPPQRSYGQLFQSDEESSGVGLSDPAQVFEVSSEEADVQRARERICELRKVDLPKPKVQGEV